MVTDCRSSASVWKPGCRQVAELWGSKPAQGRKTLLETTHLCHCLSSWQKNQAENIFFLFGWHIEIYKPLSVEQKLLRVYFFLTWARAHGKKLECKFANSRSAVGWGGEFVFIVTLLERNKVAYRVTNGPSLPWTVGFPRCGTLSAKTRTVPGQPGWLFTLLMCWGDPNHGAKELRPRTHKKSF